MHTAKLNCLLITLTAILPFESINVFLVCLFEEEHTEISRGGTAPRHKSGAPAPAPGRKIERRSACRSLITLVV